MSERPEEALAALQRWCSDEPVAVERPAAGTMSDTYIVRLRDAMVVLRGHRQRDRDRIAFEHEVLQVATAHGIPAPRAVATPTGELFGEVDGRFWSLFEWIPGDQPPRGRHSVAQATSMGRVLARTHLALTSIPHAEPPGPVEETDAAIGRIDAVLSVVLVGDETGEDEQVAVRWLRAQREWLTEAGDRQLPELRDAQVVHGDYHDANVVFDGDDVAGVLDWERVRYASVGEEIVRSVHLSFALDPGRSAAFLAGYRAGRPITDEDLDLCAQRYGYHRDRSVWLFEELYLRGNERLRPLLNRRPFVPFADSWRAFRRETP